MPRGTTKVSITLKTGTLREVDRLVKEGRFPSRGRVIEKAVAELTARRKRRRLIEALAKIDPQEERALAEESLS